MGIGFVFIGASLGAAVGATLELNGRDQTTCLVAVVAVQLAYILTWMLVQEKLKRRRLLKLDAGPRA